MKRPPRKRVAAILELLDEHFPDPKCELDYGTPWQLIVAVILSAQCTDKRVNMVTPVLFKRYRSVKALAAAEQHEVEEIIRSTGFFRNKARNIIACAKRLVEDHGGKIPQAMELLLELPGVARKTANVVLGECYGIADGVVVDTHVKRITNLLGLTDEQDPVKIEKDLMRILPEDHWIRFAHQIILHGRRTCIARRPRCGECFLVGVCPSSQA